MAELSRRLAKLSPEKRKLFERWLVDAAQTRRVDTASGTAMAILETTHTLSPHKLECRRFYDEISRSLDASEFGPFSLFLNLGYADAAGNPSYSVIALPERSLNRNSIRLVLEVIGPCDLAGRRVLDVGSGRGGTASVIAEFFKPHSVCGVDIAPAAIQFCRTHYRQPEIRFEVGDAERLPFADGSFDIVTNIESSSTYPDVCAFYQQVFRLLEPGGFFLYTDALPAGRFAECTEYLRRLGFILELDRDITANVLASCDEIAAHRMHAYAPQPDGSMADFLAAPGSHIYDEMKRREWMYRIHRWKKTARLAG